MNKKNISMIMWSIAAIALAIFLLFKPSDKENDTNVSQPPEIIEEQNGLAFTKLKSDLEFVVENSGPSRYAKASGKTLEELQKEELAKFTNVAPYEAPENKGVFYTYTGHTVYTAVNGDEYYYGVGPGEPFAFIMSGYKIIPLNPVRYNNLNHYISYATSMIYDDNEGLLRNYIVDTEEEKAEFLAEFENGRKLLSGEIETVPGQIVLDGRLIGCYWKEISSDFCIPLTDFIKYLYNGSSINEHSRIAIVESTSRMGVGVETISFFSNDTPAIYFEEMELIDGKFKQYSDTVEGEYLLLDLAVGDKLYLPIDSLIAAFGWDVYLSADGNVLNIITDQSNVSNKVIVKPSSVKN